MAININRTLPAAPAGSTNINWQSDISGNVSGYVTSPQSLVASNADLLAQTANIAPINLVATPTAGIYLLAISIVVTQAATTSSILPSVVITWQDKDSGNAQSVTVTPTNAGNLLSTLQQATFVLSSNATAIQVSTTGYASVGATPMQYALHIRPVAL